MSTEELQFPFVVCQAEGGPYDDGAFEAGFLAGVVHCGLALANTMGHIPTPLVVADKRLVPQLDLIAMTWGFTMCMHDSVAYFRKDRSGGLG